MASRRDRYKLFEAKPPLGGVLITRGSADNAGVFNYVLKREFRRDLDVEIRREGVDYFWPNLDIPIAGQPFPGMIQVDSLTAAAGTVTATRAMGQHFEVGETIIITGANDSIYNGTFTVTNATATTFQYSIAGAPVSPDTSTAIFATPVETINLIALARRPNGQTAVIAGSARRLYRYYALEDPNYISKDAADYPPGTPVNELMYWSELAADYPPGTPVDQLEYIDSNPGYWVVIGSGFATDGHRWEVVSINGYMVFNNAVDLPVTYRVEELSVVPIYELREQGIAAVGTIATINSVLLLGDLSEIQADAIAGWFNTAPDPYARYTDEATIDRTTYRVMWSFPDQPRRFAPIVPGSITAGSNTLVTAYPVLGFQVGQSITIAGAGAPHAGGTADNLEASIIFINGTSILIDEFAETTVTAADVEATDAIGSIVGFEDLEDDGSGIIKMAAISSTLVIYKDTTIFLGQYTGNVDQPFAFVHLEVQKEMSLFYKNTVALVETDSELYHVYAGRTAFYRFDLTNQQPMIMAHFEACSNIFFSAVTLANTDQIYAADNGITHEIMWQFPTTGSDKGLLFDYKFNTLSTTSLVVTAAATVRKPLAGLASGAEEDWFVMGNSSGVVLLYGKTTLAQAIPGWGNTNEAFFRRTANPYNATKQPYTSLMTCGLASFGNDYGEKDIRAVLALLGSQSPNTPFTVNIWTTQNANKAVTLVGFRLLSNPATQNLVPCGFRAYYIQVGVEVTGTDNPLRLAGTAYDVAPVDSRSMGRS